MSLADRKTHRQSDNLSDKQTDGELMRMADRQTHTDTGNQIRQDRCLADRQTHRQSDEIDNTGNQMR